MNRYYRQRWYDPSKKRYTTLIPQGETGNILRQNNGGVLEHYLAQYDRHLADHNDHLVHAISNGTPRELTVDLPNVVLTDGLTLLITLHCDVECEPKLSFNGAESQYIVSGNGSNIPGGQTEGSIILVIWSATISRWILLSTDTYTDVTKVYLPVESEYVYKAARDNETMFVLPNFDRNSDKLELNYGQTILRPGIDYTFDKTVANVVKLLDGITLRKGDLVYCTITKYVATAKRGSLKYDLETKHYPVKATEPALNRIPVPEDALSASSVVVNYGQTILRHNLDYTYSADRRELILTEIVPQVDDVFMFTVTRFIESNAELLPNNWGSTGTYRYSMNVIHTEFTGAENDTHVIPVPGYNYKKDDIWVIRDNHLYIYDVDYTIDEIGQVVLLKEPLHVGETLYFTILQGAVMDVPNFNVIRADGTSGQHILLNMSYSVLCDFYTILVKLKHDLDENPTIKCLDGPAEPIVDCFGNPVLSGYRAGSYLWLVYDYGKHTWYSLGHGQLDTTSLMPEYEVYSGTGHYGGTVAGVANEVAIPHNIGKVPSRIDIRSVEPPTQENGDPGTIGDVWSYADDKFIYVGNSGNAVSKFAWSISAEDTSANLREYVDQEIKKVKDQPAKLDTISTVVAIEEDGVDRIFNIDNYDALHDKLIVTYGQTILNVGSDYHIDPDNNGIVLETIKLHKGDTVQFLIFKQPVI